MAYNRNTTWTEYWLRHLPWKQLREWNRWGINTPEPRGLLRIRIHKIFQEWARRKREGHGGMAAKD